MQTRMFGFFMLISKLGFVVSYQTLCKLYRPIAIHAGNLASEKNNYLKHKSPSVTWILIAYKFSQNVAHYEIYLQAFHYRGICIFASGEISKHTIITSVLRLIGISLCYSYSDSSGHKEMWGAPYDRKGDMDTTWIS